MFGGSFSPPTLAPSSSQAQERIGSASSFDVETSSNEAHEDTDRHVLILIGIEITILV